jgi:hypothetical protein
VAAVRFAFGSKPGISAQDARDLADLAAQQRTLAQQSLATKLRAHANVDVEANEDLELDRNELDALAVILAEEPWPEVQPWLGHLRDEVMRARAEA